MIRKVLLACGILSSLLYVCTDILGGMLWEGYSYTSQPISALAAIGSPVRSLVTPLFAIYPVFLIAFGLGIMRIDNRKRLRITGALLIGIGFVGLLWPTFPMHLGEPVDSPANTKHSIFAGVQVILILLAMGFGATADGLWFRLYTIVTILTALTVGIVAFWLATLEQPTMWFGLIERIDVYGYLLWVAMLAIVLLRREKEPNLN
jgi:hypothetical protein